MIKKLGVLMLIGVLAVLGIKGYASYSTVQFIELLKQKYGKSFSVEYGWMSVDLEGKVSLEELVITPFSLKRPIRIENLTFSFGDTGTMLSRMQNLQSGRLDAPLSVEYSGLTMPLKGRTFVQWLASHAGSEALELSRLYQCGEHSFLDFNAIEAMGLEEVQASGRLLFERLENGDGLSLTANVKKLGKLSVYFALGLDRLNIMLKEGKLEEARIHEFSFSYQDGGYYRRLINLCTGYNNLEPETYAAVAADGWRDTMRELGIYVNQNARLLYQDRIVQGGVFSVTAKPHKPIRVDSLEHLLDQDLISYLGVNITLNGEDKEGLEAKLDGKHYRPAPPVEKEKDGQDGLQATVVLGNTDFKPTVLAALPEYVERRVRIRLNDGKKYQGLLKSADEKKIEVTLIFEGGTADYFFANDKIELVEVWR